MRNLQIFYFVSILLLGLSAQGQPQISAECFEKLSKPSWVQCGIELSTYYNFSDWRKTKDLSFDRTNFIGSTPQLEVLISNVDLAIEKKDSANLDLLNELFFILDLAINPFDSEVIITEGNIHEVVIDKERVSKRVNLNPHNYRNDTLRTFIKFIEAFPSFRNQKSLNLLSNVVKYDWKNANRRTALLALDFFANIKGEESFKLKFEEARNYMALHDGEVLFSGRSDGSYSWESEKSPRNKSFANFLSTSINKDFATFEAYKNSMTYSTRRESYKQDEPLK